VTRKSLSVAIATLTIAIGAVLVAGENPLDIYGTLLREALGDRTRIAITAARTMPILGVATAAWLSLQAGVFNIGQEGQLAMGGLAAAIVGGSLAAPSLVVIPAAILSAALVAALLAGLAAVLEARYNSPILITTLLTNFIVIAAVSYLVNYTFQESGSFGGQTKRIREAAEIPRLIAGSSLGYGVFLTIVITALTVLVIRTTRAGYSVRMTGSNRDFATTSGIDTNRVVLHVSLVAGAIAGITGAIEILGVQYRYADGALTSSGVAWIGVLAAILGRKNVRALIAASIFFGVLASGANGVARSTNVPFELIAIVQATMIIAMASQVGSASRAARPS